MRISKKRKTVLHDRLLALKEEGPVQKACGICFNASVDPELVGHLSKRWSKFSGDASYPVPSGKKNVSPAFEYNMRENHWNKRTKYGRLRWELLDFLIEATKPEA